MGCYSSQGSTSTLDLCDIPETTKYLTTSPTKYSRIAAIFADSEAESDTEGVVGEGQPKEVSTC